jgi:hypothetical protein
MQYHLLLVVTPEARLEAAMALQQQDLEMPFPDRSMLCTIHAKDFPCQLP